MIRMSYINYRIWTGKIPGFLSIWTGKCYLIFKTLIPCGTGIIMGLPRNGLIAIGCWGSSSILLLRVPLETESSLWPPLNTRNTRFSECNSTPSSLSSTFKRKKNWTSPTWTSSLPSTLPISLWTFPVKISISSWIRS
jgi:hypothetical protein